MKSAAELEKNLMSINRRSYPAYKDLRGSYQFQGYQLNIDHVQGDPFASPSKLSIQVKKIQARFPEEYYKEEHRRIALQDYLARQFGKAVSKFIFQAKGSGKSGLIGISRCGQEVLDRTAFEIKDGDLLVRFEVGFPANGRTINAFELRKILFEYLPEIADRSLYYKNLNQQEVKKCIELAEDQHYIRRELTKRRLIAFVANGSILPRESGVSQKPMKGAIAFEAPESMEVEMELPHRGKIKGMGIPEGITLIVGGGYHGKSTLLNLIGGIEHIDGGHILVGDTDLSKLSRKELALYRRNTLGFIFQFYHLVPNLTVKENIESGAYLSKNPISVEELMETLSAPAFNNRSTSCNSFIPPPTVKGMLIFAAIRFTNSVNVFLPSWLAVISR